MAEALGVTKVLVSYTDRAGKERRYKYWKARIYRDGRNQALGHHKTKAAARQAYKDAKYQQANGGLTP